MRIQYSEFIILNSAVKYGIWIHCNEFKGIIIQISEFIYALNSHILFHGGIYGFVVQPRFQMRWESANTAAAFARPMRLINLNEFIKSSSSSWRVMRWRLLSLAFSSSLSQPWLHAGASQHASRRLGTRQSSDASRVLHCSQQCRRRGLWQ